MTSHKPIKLPLSMAEVDRAAHLRLDESYLKTAWQNAKVLQFQDEKFLSADNQLQIVEGQELGEFQSQSDYFLGVEYVQSSGPNTSEDKEIFAHYFVRNYSSEVQTGKDLPVENLRTLREIGAFLSPRDIGLSVHAQGLANWHKKHPRCSQCGAATTVISGGSVRKCLIDESEHYPRTDSEIIVTGKQIGRAHV